MGTDTTSQLGRCHRPDQHPGHGVGPRKAGCRVVSGTAASRGGWRPAGHPAVLIGTFCASAVTNRPSGFGSTLRTVSWNGSSGRGRLTEMLLA
ncbi:hypothetical protein GA0070604_5851 [Micromonospora eburnea]|uniref:Uncharacterized protein n=1 Tax=Micromonospora eburnea TaxID=227316 RepID=A0A1C6VKX1_9ACTN|nr:hypothetical protein GA0070604_5851 [Micromonospora eburnea]